MRGVGKQKGRAYYKCLCDCGNIKEIRRDGLISGNIKSCGCLNRKNYTKHGRSRTLEYKSWQSMLERCNNPKKDNYNRYGGRGITVCGRWYVFKNFFKDMGKRPKDLTLERIDNDGNYEPSNCKWATRTAQMRNRRLQKTNTTGINGVGWVKKRKKYRVNIRANNKRYFIGEFNALEQAIKARKQAEEKYWKEI